MASLPGLVLNGSNMCISCSITASSFSLSLCVCVCLGWCFDICHCVHPLDYLVYNCSSFGCLHHGLLCLVWSQTLYTVFACSVAHFLCHIKSNIFLQHYHSNLQTYPMLVYEPFLWKSMLWPEESMWTFPQNNSYRRKMTWTSRATKWYSFLLHLLYIYQSIA